MTPDLHYSERLTSRRTELLFVALTLLFLALAAWRATRRGPDGWTIGLFGLCAFFLFYSLNYRTLSIDLNGESVRLRFGVFTWDIPLRDIEDCRLDRTTLWRIGGAGIHFTWLGGRYRAMFNFLEYPRLVLRLRRRKGPVRDVAFSTRRPEEIARLIQPALAADFSD